MLGIGAFNELLEPEHRVAQPLDLAKVVRPEAVAVFPSYWDNAEQDIYLSCDKEHLDPEHGFVMLCDASGRLVGTGPECEAERYDAFNSEAGLAKKRGVREAYEKWRTERSSGK